MVWVFLCFIRTLFKEHGLPHMSQTWSASVLCVSSWFRIPWREEHSQEQVSHLWVVTPCDLPLDFMFQNNHCQPKTIKSILLIFYRLYQIWTYIIPISDQHQHRDGVYRAGGGDPGQEQRAGHQARPLPPAGPGGGAEVSGLLPVTLLLCSDRSVPEPIRDAEILTISLLQVRRRLHFVSLAARVFLTNGELVSVVNQTSHLQDVHLFAIVKTWAADTWRWRKPVNPGDQL